ncbi:MAG: tetratricopeptide repeat protein, partial [Saprospiraceae bacterium]
DAMRAIKRVIEEHPEEAHWGYLAWGSLLQRQEKLPQAVRKYKQAIKIKPDFLLPLTNMAWLQRRIGETKEAHQHMRQATQQNWDDIDRLRGNVWFFHMEEDYAMADSIFSRIMELAPDSPFSYMSWADSQFSRGNQERALELLKQNEALFGDTADGLAMKAFAKFVAKDTLGALADIEAAFELDPAHPAATSNTMRAYYMKEDYERIFEIAAMADWDNMKEDDLFQQQDALDIWAQAHIQLKEYEAARQLCRRNILRGQFYAGSYITYAKTFAYENQRDSLYHYMRAGFEKGFEEKWLELDKPPLDKFANDPPFQKLLEKYRRTQPLKG